MYAVAVIFGHIFFQTYFSLIQYAFLPLMKTKYCKFEKFQIGHNTGKIYKCFFYGRLSTAPKAFFFFLNNASFLNFFFKKTSYTLLVKKLNIVSPKKFKSLHYLKKKTHFWCGGKTSIKKNFENFPVLGPIWNSSDLQYFSVFNQKRVWHLFKKNFKSLHYFFKHAFGAVERRP